MGTEGTSPGNGNDSPFGDGDGATQAAGPSSGAHDFITDPKSNAPATGGRDFTKESRPQGGDRMAPDINTDSIPAGGRLPFPSADPHGPSGKDVGTLVGAEKHKPFSLGGGAPAAAAPAGDIPDDIG